MFLVDLIFTCVLSLPQPTVDNSSEPFWTNHDTWDDAFPWAEFDFDTSVSVDDDRSPKGFAIFGDFWGSMNLESYHALTGNLKDRAEVWFDRVHT
jgi:hypothetical protein